MSSYDIIGDVHGQAEALHRLLRTLGYVRAGSGWRHPQGRKVIFLGDFVDVGPRQLEVVNTVRRMIDAGDALAVMGNHELNAIAWFLPDPQNPGEYLRPHRSEPWGAKNRHQHSAFLAEVEHHPALHRELVEWFLQLPLWLDLPHFRVVHACWHPQHVAYLRSVLGDGGVLSAELMREVTPLPTEEDGAASSGLNLRSCVETLTKGPEIALPLGTTFRDTYGIERRHMRMRWWAEDAQTYRTAGLVELALRNQIPDVQIPDDSRIPLTNDKPVFIGHYWLTGTPAPLSPRVACVDYSAGRGDRLCAYRWDGETQLSAEKFVCTRV